MPDVSALDTHRTDVVGRASWAAYREHEERLQLVGLRGPSLARTDDDDHVLVDLAACLTVAHSLPRLALSPVALRRLRTSDPPAHRLLTRATTAYFSSGELRGELGGMAVLSFEQLRTALSEVG